MTPTDLNRYKRLLTSMQGRLQHEIDGMQEAILANNLARGEQDHVPSEAADKEIALEAVEESISHEVAAALDRIELGTFGRCIDCDAKIPRTRLDVIPYTRYCVRCEVMRHG